MLSHIAPFVETPAPALDPAVVTPGIEGFLVFFALALASWFLYRSLLKQVRRVDVRARQQREQEEEARADAARAVDASPAAGVPGADGAPGPR